MDTSGIYGLLTLAFTFMVGLEALQAGCEYHALRHSDSLRTKNVIQSPNYPFQYPRNICVVWFYSGISGSDFFLRILDLDLPGEMGLCSPNSDILIIGLAQRKLLCGKLTKAFQPKYHMMLTKNDETVYIIFNSTSHPHKGTGFKAEYYTRPPLIQLSQSPAELDSQVELTTAKPWSWKIRQPNRDCHKVLTSSFSGHIPQTPLNARTIHQCNGLITWLVEAPKPKIQFSHATATFLVDISPCRKSLMNSKDSLELFDGKNASMPLLLRCRRNGSVIGSQITHTDSFYIRYQFTPSSYQDYNKVKFKMKAKCIEGFVSCGNENACYDPSARCNGSWECPIEGRDELNCGSTLCPTGKYSCDMSSNQCYEEKDRCNGKGSCTNYKDEMNCDPSKCNQNKGLFLCSNSRCIYEKWRCDGTNDCADNSDESGCGVLMTPRVIVAAVVGSLLCSLLMVVALGCVCKVYRLRQIQLIGAAGPGGACCPAHGRHDSPLTRQLAEMFRQRAPPPPYHEAMLTSRPYHEMVLESADESGVATLPGDSRRGYAERGGRIARDRARMVRPLRRRESDPSSSGVNHTSQRQGSRRQRGRRPHSEVNQQDSSLHTADRNTGFIEVGSLSLLCSGLGQEESSGGLSSSTFDPPPYSLTDPVTAATLEVREEAADSSTGDDSEEVSDDADASEEQGMPLRRQRKARSRINPEETRRRTAEVLCLEMSQVTSRRDQRLQTISGQSVNPLGQTSLQRDENEENCERSKIEDATQASLSLSSATGLDSPTSFERENNREGVVRLEEEESDSDCILLGEEDDKDRVKEDDKDDEDAIFEEESDDSDTTCLLSSV